MSTSTDIRVGKATVVRHDDGGWVLPGGIRVRLDRAHQAATQLDELIRGILLRRPEAPAAVIKPVTTRRKASKEAARWAVSA